MCLYGRWPLSRDYCTKSTVYCLARFFQAQNHIFMAPHVGHPFTTFVKGGWIINTCPQISGSKGPFKFVYSFTEDPQGAFFGPPFTYDIWKGLFIVGQGTLGSSSLNIATLREVTAGAGMFLQLVCTEHCTHIGSSLYNE